MNYGMNGGTVRERFQESSSVQTYKQIVWTSKEQNE
jgi:hypothetical protein